MLPGTLVVGFLGMNTGGARLWAISTPIFWRILVRTGALRC